ncbi:aminoimidazole riboside kinase [Mesobacillus maritimus]|uniref:Aminoimidazole riboside kinase n=1 Tax=Mesobacillus maritimus TaxID=1643336 RepID=A0ABS7K1K8_9BACI|nr:aminoimidazole riboside kinase [Mesobacillus maritimus]MBY0096138.1 aminoimidazole riboside kinase [Mesobacillus maritimus]
MIKNGLITLGEALIDFIPVDSTNLTYQKSPGGAPANVAVGAARLGMRSAFIGKLGQDVLGEFLVGTLSNYGVNVSSISFTDSYRTNLVFVTLDSTGERSFSFFVKESADLFLEKTDVNEEIFKNHKIFHFGTISMLQNPVREATLKAIEYAKQHGLIVSFDPNVRLSLWKDENVLRETIFSVLPDVDVLKLSDEELLFLTGTENPEVIAEWIKEYDLSLVFLTKGAEGSIVFTKSGSMKVDALKVHTVDTTGAGDAFVSGFLYCLNEREMDLAAITIEEVAEIAKFASVSGGLAASEKGAMTALPTLEAIHKITTENRS